MNIYYCLLQALVLWLLIVKTEKHILSPDKSATNHSQISHTVAFIKIFIISATLLLGYQINEMLNSALTVIVINITCRKYNEFLKKRQITVLNSVILCTHFPNPVPSTTKSQGHTEYKIVTSKRVKFQMYLLNNNEKKYS